MKEFLKGIELDEVVLAVLAPLLLEAFRGKPGGKPGDAKGVEVATASMLGTLGDAITKMIERSGATLRDEHEWRATVGKLSAPDRKRIADIEALLTEAELRLLRRIALSSAKGEPKVVELEPEVKENGKVKTPAKKVVVYPSSEEKQMEFFRALAKMVADENARKTVARLRRNELDPGRFSELWESSVGAVGKSVLSYFGLTSESTPEEIVRKIRGRLPEVSVPDVNAPKENDDAGFLMRLGRYISPGAYKGRPPLTKGQVTLLAIVMTILFSAYQVWNSEVAGFVKNYVTQSVSSMKKEGIIPPPTQKSAGTPTDGTSQGEKK